MTINGTYKLRIRNALVRLELNAEGETLSGAMEGEGFSGGTINGDSFSFETTMKTPMGKPKVTMEGTVEGDNISGVAKTMMGKFPFSGVRV